MDIYHPLWVNKAEFTLDDQAFSLDGRNTHDGNIVLSFAKGKTGPFEIGRTKVTLPQAVATRLAELTMLDAEQIKSLDGEQIIAAWNIHTDAFMDEITITAEHAQEALFGEVEQYVFHIHKTDAGWSMHLSVAGQMMQEIHFPLGAYESFWKSIHQIAAI